MNRTIIKLIILTAFIALVAIVPWESSSRGVIGGCIACHPQFSEKIPKEDGAAADYGSKIHRSHYAKLGESAQCNLCHQIDQQGNLQLIGMETASKIKTTNEKLAKMQPYYKSWATSAFLDQRHGKRGITCLKCHGEVMPESTVSKERCFTCHGTYEKLAERSPFHNGTLYPHFTSEPLECNQCHKGHKKSELVCSQCHHVDAKMP